jgi:hypothetical protein
VDAGVVDAGARRVERVDADVVAAAGPGVDRLAVADLLVGDVDADVPTARFVPVVAFAVAGVEAIPGVPTARVPTPEVPAAGFAATDRRLGVVVAPPDPAPADAERADPAADRGPGLRPRLGVGPTDDFAGDVAGGLTGETAVAASTAADPTAVAASVATSPASPIAARAQSPIRPTTVATSAAASSSCRRRFAICFRPCFASARASCSIRRVSVARAASSFLPSLARSRAARFVNGSAAARADATRSPAAARTSAGTLEIVCFPDRFDAFAITRLRSGRLDIWVSGRHGTVPPRGGRRGGRASSVQDARPHPDGDQADRDPQDDHQTIGARPPGYVRAEAGAGHRADDQAQGEEPVDLAGHHLPNESCGG